MSVRTLYLLALLLLVTRILPGQVTPLDYFLQEGLSNSPVLKDLNNQVRMNGIDSMLVRASRVPQVGFNTYMMYAPIINGYGYSEPITNGQNLTSTVTVSQQVFNGKTIEARYNKYNIENQSIRNSMLISTADLTRAITNQYLVAYALFGEIGFSEEIYKTSSEEETVLKTLVDKGLFKQTDFLAFQIALQALNLNIRDLKIQYQGELTLLKVLCGISDTTGVNLALPQLQPVPYLKGGNSIFFHRFTIDSLRLVNERTLLDRQYKPTLSWFGDAGLVNNEPRYIYQNFGISIGLSLNMPVYDGNQRNLNYHKLKASDETRMDYQNTYKTQYSLQLQQLYTELARTREILPVVRKQLELSGELTRLDLALLNNGGITITDYILAMKNYLNIRRDLNQYEVRIQKIINEINYWNE
jgi:outer membrane protein TolC